MTCRRTCVGREPRLPQQRNLFDRPNLDGHVQRGTLTFSDGSSSIDVADIADDGSMKTIAFDASTITWIRFQVTHGSGRNRGLSDIEVLSNIAPTTHTLGPRQRRATGNRGSAEDRVNNCACCFLSPSPDPSTCSAQQ